MQLLSVQNLSKNYDKFRLKDVSFHWTPAISWALSAPAAQARPAHSSDDGPCQDSGRVFVMGRDFGTRWN